MKIIEAIKEFPLIIKKMEANSRKIQEYSSALSINDDLPFGSIENQKKEVASLVQSNNDLYNRYMFLARSLAHTNTQVMVEINGETRSIVEWLHIRGAGRIRPQAFDALVATYSSLNTNGAQQQLRQPTRNADLTEKALQIIRCYDQKEVDEKAVALQDMRSTIDAKLEVVNATTDLIEIN